jgi:hypothetical protein
MLEDVLSNIATLIPSGGAQDSLPVDSLPITYLATVLGALVLCRFTGRIGSLTMPLNCSALFIGALLSNWALGGLDLPMDHQLQQPLLISMLGMVAGAFVMMWWVQDDNLQNRV